MKTRKLGNTGIEVSEIAFGGVEIGMPYGIGIHSEADMLSKGDAIILLHEALDKGINFFDTARGYGESEAIMGEAFEDRRSRVVLSTKCSPFRDENGKIPPYAQLKKSIERSLHESLKDLKTDYVDVFMLHQADMGILDCTDVKDIFERLKSTGKIRATGASTYAAEETARAIETGWDVIQTPFNLMDQRQERNFLEADKHGVGIVIRSVLMKGLLSDKGRDLHIALRDVEQHIQQYRDLLDDDTRDISTLATRFALSFGEVASVLVGIDRLEYLEKATLAISGKLFDQKLLLKARALAYPDPEFLDLPKWDRLGWLK